MPEGWGVSARGAMPSGDVRTRPLASPEGSGVKPEVLYSMVRRVPREPLPPPLGLLAESHDATRDVGLLPTPALPSLSGCRGRRRGESRWPSARP